jgi:subtilase family serine protease
VESLETRVVPAAVAYPTYVLGHGHGHGVSPFDGPPGLNGYSPAQIRHAYGFDQVSFNGGTVAADGSGTTIAIVDAFNDPNIVSDLQQFDAEWGLPNLNQLGGPTFKVENQNGGTTLPANNTGWATEISLDVEWAHAVAPGASILLVEASSASFFNLTTAVTTAANTAGVVAVSMSWGGNEFSSQTGFDSIFQSPAGQGVTFIASAGDTGGVVNYPASSPNVLSVGGTTLNLNANNTIASESGWSSGGGGVSVVEAEPGYQVGVVPPSITTTGRATPDVAYDSDPNTGFDVYDSYSFPSAPWQQFGGTSDAAPQWAALLAIADQGRALQGLGSLDGATQTLPDLYQLTGDFNDITGGNNGFPAGPGYDLVTGLGSPIANKLIPDLIGGSSTNVAKFGVTASTGNHTAGSSFTVTVTAETAAGSTVPTYTGTVSLTGTDPLAVGLPTTYTFQPGDNGVHTFTVTLKTAGGRTVTATDTSNGSVTGGVTVTVAPAAASQLAFGVQPANALTGQAITPAVTVKVEDQFGNVLTGDNTDQVSLTLGTAGATLSGGGATTVSGGVATFSSLTVSVAGPGYTLTASGGGLTPATSNAFNVTDPTVTHFSVTATIGNPTAGSSFTVTVTALDANGHTVSGYNGTVTFSTTDPIPSGLPGSYTFQPTTDAGAHTFTVTLFTAGVRSVTATDTAHGSVTGSVTVTVGAASASQLVFGVPPSNAAAGVAISPAVTVKVEDQYGNLVSSDNTDQVTLALGANPGGATLGGSTATVSGGVATFSSLTVSAAGTGYTLTAAAAGLAGATSQAFNVSANTSTVVEDFESTHMWNVVGSFNPTAFLTAAAAHDGQFGLDTYSGNDWIYRSDAGAQIQAGDTIAVWLQFAGSADGRAYFAFGANTSGTLALVAAPNTGQLILMQNPNFGFQNLAAVSQSYLPNHWYRLEVDWGTSGTVVGKLFDSNGTTLLNSVTASTQLFTSGGFGFRAIGSDKYWDTVTVTHGVNNFTAQVPSRAGTVSQPPATSNAGLLAQLFAQSWQRGDSFWDYAVLSLWEAGPGHRGRRW